MKSTSRFLLVTVAFVAAQSAPAEAQPAQIPNLQSNPGGWTHPFYGAFPAVQGSAIPLQQDPGHPYVNPVADQPNWRRLQSQSQAMGEGQS